MIDLDAVEKRYSKALDAKPGKGPITEDGIAAITDSVCDVPELVKAIRDVRKIVEAAAMGIVSVSILRGVVGP